MEHIHHHHDCSCDCEHEHEHENSTESKFTQAFKKYNLDVDDEKVKNQVATLLAHHLQENNTKEVKKFLLNSVELTTLKTTDSEESVLKFIEKVNEFDTKYPELGHVATVCVYPNFAKVCHDSLENENIEIACVSGSFPSSQTFTEVKIAETAMAIHDGATEIDIVMPVGKFLSEDYEGVADEISELKSVCGEHKLKVILETGCLKTAANIKKASILAMYSGADYIKTSTGKLEPAATPEAAFVMCQAIKEYYEQTGIQIGLKPAGGMKTVEDALTYYTIVKEVLGEKWLNNTMLRLGTSSLANKLLSEIVGEEIKFF
ncbi:MAG: deoxyribose-phosphate aldolase [Prevotellaceae bacterium]|nr:deoxyribose-phosphate aldolase [Prevotellaceae bacterium]